MAPQKTDFTPHLENYVYTFSGVISTNYLSGGYEQKSPFWEIHLSSDVIQYFTQKSTLRMFVGLNKWRNMARSPMIFVYVFQVSSRSKCDKNFLSQAHGGPPKCEFLKEVPRVPKKKSHMFDINLWWTLSKSPSPGYKPATIGRNQCYEQNGCCIFVFNRKAATSENCPPNHLNWYSTTGQWCCKSM